MCGLRVPRDASNEVRLCEGPLAALEYRKYIPHSRSRWSVTTLRQRSVPICQRDQSFMGVSAPPTSLRENIWMVPSIVMQKLGMLVFFGEIRKTKKTGQP